MDWDKLRTFHAVAEAKSFTAAGEKLHLTQSSISRQIANLENSLDVKLFHRHARGLIPTEQGEILYKTAHEIFGKLALVETRLKEVKEKTRGELRITTTFGMGTTWLVPRLKIFRERYPEIEPRLIFENKMLNLSMREADVALRLSRPTQPDLIFRYLFSAKVSLYASASYLRKHSLPQKIDDLYDHDLIAFGWSTSPCFEGENWLFSENYGSKSKFEPAMTINSSYGMLRAVRADLGLACLPNFMAESYPDLVRVEIDGLAAPTFEVFFVYPEELRNSERINAFREFIIDQLSTSEF